MLRPVLLETLLFALPFIAYGLWLSAQRTNPVRRSAWADAPVIALLGAAVLATFAGLAVVRYVDSAPAGSTYEPAHLVDGHVVPPTLQ